MKRRDNLLLFVFLMIVVVSTAKYCSSGEKYIFETDAADEILYLEKGNEISQQIIIDKKSRWNTESYGIKFDQQSSENGRLKLTIRQDGDDKQQYFVNLQDLQQDGSQDLQGQDEWFVFEGFDYSVLDKENAVIAMEAVEGSIGICVVENRYNIPGCQLNGADTGKTLVQRYAVPYVNKEYILRVVVYLVLVLLLLGMGYILAVCAESKSVCNVIQGGLIICFYLFMYIYGSLFYFEPTWCETVTDFMDSALSDNIWKNLTMPGAGYLPLLLRLISVFLIKFLHIKAYYALFVMQAVAYGISGYVLSFFCKKNFHAYINLKYRFAVSLILMIQVSDLATLTFINFVPYGMYMMLLFFIADSTEWSRYEYVGIILLSCLFCLSKGQYVVVFPFMILILLLFRRYFNRRDIIFIFCMIVSSGIQLLYSFLYPSAGGRGWVDVNGSASQNDYILKLLCGLLRDIPNIFLSMLENNIYAMNGISALMILIFWIAVLTFFVRNFVWKYKKKVPVDEEIKNMLIMFIFVCGQRLFFMLSVYGVSDADILSDEFWSFSPISLGSRYEVFGYFSAIIFCIILIKFLCKKRPYIKQAAIAAFAVCAMISNIRLQMKGLGTDQYSVNREYMSGIYSEACLLKDIESVDTRMVPIRTNSWLYSKNAKMYYIGTDVLGMNSEMISDVSVRNAKINLHDFANIRKNSGIWQIFIKKANLVDNCRYQIKLFDAKGNMIKQMWQDNTVYQKIVSFSSKEAVYGVDGIQILNERGEDVWIENGIYLVSGTEDELLHKKMFEVNTNSDFTVILDHKLEQPFIAAQDVLSSVQLRMGTFNRINTGILNFEIVEQNGTIISRKEVDVSELEDNRWKDVSFENCGLIKGEEYAVRIYSDDFDAGNCVAVYTETDVDARMQHAKCNGMEQNYCLELKIYGESSDE